MASYHCSKLVFTCWSIQSTALFEVQFDHDLWQMVLDEVSLIYNTHCPKRPTCRSKRSLEIQERVKLFQEKNVEFVAEIASCSAVLPSSEHRREDGDGLYVEHFTPMRIQARKNDLDGVQGTLHDTQRWIDLAYELCRTTAKEILVFMLNDLDRRYRMDIPNAYPIAYAMKGPSLPCSSFHSMVKEVIAACKRHGLHVLPISTDGQWGRFGVRDENETPLTLVQLA